MKKKKILLSGLLGISVLAASITLASCNSIPLTPYEKTTTTVTPTTGSTTRPGGTTTNTPAGTTTTGAPATTTTTGVTPTTTTTGTNTPATTTGTTAPATTTGTNTPATTTSDVTPTTGTATQVTPTTGSTTGVTPTTTSTTQAATTYTVTIDAKNGKDSTAITIEEGGKATKPTTDPTKDGFVFDNWYLEGATNPFDFDTVITANITIEARWIDEATLTHYTITFDSNVDAIQVIEGRKATAPTAPTRDGFEFAGWYLENATEAFDFDATTITDDISLYAKWNVVINLYELAYDAQGYPTQGELIEKKTFLEGSNISIDDPEKTGFKFVGWFTDNHRYHVSEFVGNESVDLYAYYVNSSLTFVNATTDGFMSSASNTSTISNGVISFKNSLGKDEYGNITNAYAFEVFTKAIVTISIDTEITATDSTKYASVIFYNGKEQSYKTTNLTPNGKTAHDDVVIETDGYDIISFGRYGNTGITAKNITVTIEYPELNVFELKVLNYNDEYEYHSIIVCGDETIYDALKRDGLIQFGYEYTLYDENSENTIDMNSSYNGFFISDGLAKVLKEYTITYKDGENVVNTETDVTVDSFNEYNALDVAGKILEGWYREATFETLVDSSDLEAILNGQDSAILYGKFVEANTVTLKAEGNIYEIFKVKDGEKVSTALNYNDYMTPEKEGYHFVNWVIEGTDTVFDFENDVVNDDVNLVAVFEINSYTINFDSQGGSTVNPIIEEYNQDFTKPSDPTLSGYIFENWYEVEVDFDVDEDSYEPGTYYYMSEGHYVLDNGDYNDERIYYSISYEPFDFTDLKAVRNIDLIAKWSEDPNPKYYLTLDLNYDGAPQLDNIVVLQSSPTKTMSEITNPERAGYRFDGWYKESTTDNKIGETLDLTEDTIIYAKWVERVTLTINYANFLGDQIIELDANSEYNLDDPIVDYCTFNGWFENADYSTQITTDKITVESSTTIYAKFTINYNDIYNLNEFTTVGNIATFNGNYSDKQLANTADAKEKLTGQIKNDGTLYVYDDLSNETLYVNAIPGIIADKGIIKINTTINMGDNGSWLYLNVLGKSTTVTSTNTVFSIGNSSYNLAYTINGTSTYVPSSSAKLTKNVDHTFEIILDLYSSTISAVADGNIIVADNVELEGLEFAGIMFKTAGGSRSFTVKSLSVNYAGALDDIKDVLSSNIDSFVASVDMTKYTTNADEFNTKSLNGKTAIDEATSAQAAITAYRTAIDDIKSIKSDAEMVVVNAIATQKSNLDTYYNANKDNYKINATTYDEKLEDGKDLIDTAESEARAAEYYATAQGYLDAVTSDATYKANAKSTLLADFPASDYTLTQNQSDYETAIVDLDTDLDSAYTAQAVTDAIATARTALEAISPNSAYTFATNDFINQKIADLTTYKTNIISTNHISSTEGTKSKPTYDLISAVTENTLINSKSLASYLDNDPMPLESVITDLYDELIDMIDGYVTTLLATDLTITFTNTELASRTIKYGETFVMSNAEATPTKDDCAFDGWYLDSTFVTLFDGDNEALYDDCTLYAKWYDEYSMPGINVSANFKNITQSDDGTDLADGTADAETITVNNYTFNIGTADGSNKTSQSASNGLMIKNSNSYLSFTTTSTSTIDLSIHINGKTVLLYYGDTLYGEFVKIKSGGLGNSLTIDASQSSNLGLKYEFASNENTISVTNAPAGTYYLKTKVNGEAIRIYSVSINQPTVKNNINSISADVVAEKNTISVSNVKLTKVGETTPTIDATGYKVYLDDSTVEATLNNGVIENVSAGNHKVTIKYGSYTVKDYNVEVGINSSSTYVLRAGESTNYVEAEGKAFEGTTGTIADGKISVDASTGKFQVRTDEWAIFNTGAKLSFFVNAGATVTLSGYKDTIVTMTGLDGNQTFAATNDTISKKYDVATVVTIEAQSNGYIGTLSITYPVVLSNANITFGLDGNYKTFEGFNNTCGGYDQEGNSQVKKGTIKFIVAAGSTLTINGVGGYTQYNITGEANTITEAQYQHTYDVETEITITIADVNNYFESIVIL